MLVEETYPEINGFRIFVKRIIFNQNFPYIIFLHEGLGSVGIWRDFPEKLCKLLNYNAIVYDRRNYGKSDLYDFNGNPKYLEEEAKLILYPLIQLFKIKKPILYGHSDGGSIALIFAGLYPDIPSKVISEAAHVISEQISIDGIQALVDNSTRAAFIRKLEKYQGKHAWETFNCWSQNLLSNPFEYYNYETVLNSITCPILALQGIDDEFGSVLQLEMIKEKCKNTNVITKVIPNSAHSPHWQNYDELVNDVTKFLV